MQVPDRESSRRMSSMDSKIKKNKAFKIIKHDMDERQRMKKRGTASAVSNLLLKYDF